SGAVVPRQDTGRVIRGRPICRGRSRVNVTAGRTEQLAGVGHLEPERRGAVAAVRKELDANGLGRNIVEIDVHLEGVRRLVGLHFGLAESNGGPLLLERALPLDEPGAGRAGVRYPAPILRGRRHVVLLRIFAYGAIRREL